MDSSFFLISNTSQASTSNPSSLNDLEQSSSSSSMFNYDPFDSFSILDQQGLRLYDFLGGSGGGGGGGGGVSANCDWAQGLHQHHGSSHGLNHIGHNSHHHNHLNHHSPLISSQNCAQLEGLDQHPIRPASLATSASTSTLASSKSCHFSPHFPFQTDPSQPGDDGEEENHHHHHHHHHNNVDDDDDLHGALTSFVEDLGGVDSDAGYNSSEVDLFPHANTPSVATCLTTNSDCSDLTEAYYLRLALEQENCGNSNSSHEFSTTTTINHNNFSDINNNNNNNYNNSSNNYLSYNVTMSCNGDSNTSQTTGTATKRSVLMNLLIDGSDVGAGYTSHNCRALPQARRQQNQQQLQQQPQYPRPQY